MSSAINVYPANKIVVLASNLNQNIPDQEFLTGSVAACHGYLYKVVMAEITGSAMTANSGSLYIGISYDNVHWNYINNISGSIYAVDSWEVISFDKPVPYIRGLVLNDAGAAKSGSVVVLGFKDV